VDAVQQVDPHGRVLLIDDGSTDGTREVASRIPAPAQVVHLAQNVGQFRATLAGLRRSGPSDTVVVLDGDLQDPPEVLCELVHTLEASRDHDVVFAVKRAREDAGWFRAGRAVYGLLTSLPGSAVIPPGAGAYVAMRGDLARRVSRLEMSDANLAAVLIALRVNHTTHPYDKVARYDGVSRVGPWGLVKEAVPSMILTGSVSQLLVLCGLLAVLCGFSVTSAQAATLWFAVTCAVLAFTLRQLSRRQLTPARHPSPEEP
jgi:dolichol-phosphate mannosyltransferase